MSFSFAVKELLFAQTAVFSSKFLLLTPCRCSESETFFSFATIAVMHPYRAMLKFLLYGWDTSLESTFLFLMTRRASSQIIFSTGSVKCITGLLQILFLAAILSYFGHKSLQICLFFNVMSNIETCMVKNGPKMTNWLLLCTILLAFTWKGSLPIKLG